MPVTAVSNTSPLQAGGVEFQVATEPLTDAGSGVGWTSQCRFSGKTRVPAMPIIKQQLDAVGARQIDLCVFSDDSVRMTIDRAPYDVAVFSGGGNKCLVIPKGIEAMETAGVLKGIKHICGASGGALIGMALASGMSGKEIREIVASMKMLEELNSPHPGKKALQKMSEAVAPERLKSIAGVLAHLHTNAHGFQATLENIARSGLLKSIKAHPGAINDPGVREVHDRLLKGGEKGVVTLNDLAVVSAVVPNVRTLEVTSTARLKSGPELVIFNHHDHPHMSVAKATLISGAFPFLFNRVLMEFKGEMIEFQDGGLMSNTPVPEHYLKPQDPAVISSSAPLVMVFEQPGTEEPSIDKFPRNPADSLIGVEVSSKWILQQVRIRQMLKDKPWLGATQTRTGDYSGLIGGTMNFYMPAQTRAALGSKTYNNLLCDLEMRKGAREAYHFASLDDALLALDDEACSEVYEAAGKSVDGSTKHFRDAATGLLSRLDQMMRNNGSAADDIVEQLGSLAIGAASRCDWLAKRLMQVPERLVWLQARLRERGKGAEVIQAALKVEQRNQCHQIALHIAEKLTEYCLNSGQGHNKALLGAACKRLIDTFEQTPETLNVELDSILQHYQPKHPESSRVLLFTWACKTALAKDGLAELAVSFRDTINSLSHK